MEEKKPSVIKEIFSWVITIALAVVAAWLINNFILFKAEVDGPCMETTLFYGDEMYGLRVAYWFTEPKRGDIITFRAPDKLDDPDADPYIKRIIGLPGETVEIKNGVVYINGTALHETYTQNPMIGTYGPYEVPEDSYFMLGDNRDNSHDSVDWNNRYVKKEYILAKMYLRYKPDWQWFSDVDYTE